MPVVLSVADAEVLATRALCASRTRPDNALATARALVRAEADGQSGHGLSRVPSYSLQSQAGKVDGFSTPQMQQVAAALLRINAAAGFAYPALDLAINALPGLARQQGIAAAAIHHSHHFGVAGAHAERLAAQGVVALVLGNTPKAMNFFGGRQQRLGTNPLAFAAPLTAAGQPPLVIDLAMTVAARGKIVAAQQSGQSIPSDWATDADGKPTTDPEMALAGSLAPIGGAKGAALALMIEILAGALTGSAFGWEASSMFDAAGGPPHVGQLLIAVDPGHASGGAYPERMRELLAAFAAEPAVRMPGMRRLENRARAAADGLSIPASLHQQIAKLAAATPSC